MHTVWGGIPGVVPVDGGVGAGEHAGAEAMADELQHLRPEAVAVRVLGEAPGGGPTRQDRLGKAQPFRHHGVHSVTPHQNLHVRAYRTTGGRRKILLLQDTRLEIHKCYVLR